MGTERKEERQRGKERAKESKASIFRVAEQQVETEAAF